MGVEMRYPPGDNLPVLDWVYVIPTSAITKRGQAVSVQEQSAIIEMWENPVTGVMEPFVAVYLDENGRLPRITVKVAVIEEVAAREKARRFPDWGGQDGDMRVNDDVQSPALWLIAGLASSCLLWMALLLLRGR